MNIVHNAIQTKCGECKIEWVIPAKSVRTSPPSNTVAVVVDVRENNIGGRFGYSKLRARNIGSVGTEERGNLVMVPVEQCLVLLRSRISWVGIHQW